MSATVSTPSRVLRGPPRSERAMGRIAWFILAAASLLTVGSIAAAMIWALATFTYRTVSSTIEQTSGVVLRQAADGPGESSAASGSALFEADRLHVTAGSTARVRLFDGSVVELFPGARLRLDRMRVPRLAALGKSAEAQLGLEAGVSRLTVDSDEEALSFSVVTPNGIVELEPGTYTLRVADGATRISVWEGKATVSANTQVVDVPAGRKLVVQPDGTFEPTELLENVLANGSFSARFDGWSTWDQQEARADSQGQRQIVVPTETNSPGLALKLFRQSPAQTHNETGVRREFHVDVSGSRAVALDLWLRIDSASLSGGGYLGTEYPVMLRVRYQNIRGGEHVWTRGFYYANPEQRPTTNGELIRQGVWTHYRFDLSRLQPIPMILEEIQVLAAGHSYDSSVADLKILVD